MTLFILQAQPIYTLKKHKLLILIAIFLINTIITLLYFSIKSLLMINVVGTKKATLRWL